MNNKKIVYYFNYSECEQNLTYIHNDGVELTSEKRIANGEEIKLSPWNLIVVEED